MSFKHRFSDSSLRSLGREIIYRGDYILLLEIHTLDVQPQETNLNPELYLKIIMDFITNIDSEPAKKE